MDQHLLNMTFCFQVIDIPDLQIAFLTAQKENKKIQLENMDGFYFLTFY